MHKPATGPILWRFSCASSIIQRLPSLLLPLHRHPSCLLALGIRVLEFLWGKTLNSIFCIPTCHLVGQRRETWQIPTDSWLPDESSPSSSCWRCKSAACVWKEAILDLWQASRVGCALVPQYFPGANFYQRWAQPCKSLPSDWSPSGKKGLPRMVTSKHALVCIGEKRAQRKRISEEGANMFGKFREIWMVQIP